MGAIVRDESTASVPIEEKRGNFYGDEITAVLVEVSGQRQVYILVTTPRGSRAGGFWIDAGVSSHTVVRFIQTSETRAQSNWCIVWHVLTLDTLLLLPRGAIYPRTAKTELSCQKVPVTEIY